MLLRFSGIVSLYFILFTAILAIRFVDKINNHALCIVYISERTFGEMLYMKSPKIEHFTKSAKMLRFSLTQAAFCVLL